MHGAGVNIVYFNFLRTYHEIKAEINRYFLHKNTNIYKKVYFILLSSYNNVHPNKENKKKRFKTNEIVHHITSYH